MKWSFMFGIVSLYCSLFTKCIYTHSSNSLLMVVSIEGFRWDYLDKMKHRDTPNFDRLVTGGVKSEYVKPVFPPKSFPAHFTIATGLHAESHGVVANTFYDPQFKEQFNMADSSQAGQRKWFDNDGKVEPIWITNQRGAQTIFPKRSGVLFWPGGNAGFGKMFAHKWKPWAESDRCNSTCRIKKIVEWFATEEDPINLGMVHITEVDIAGHKYGPDSDEVLDAIEKIDRLIGLLIELLEEHQLFHRVNLIITSDHGMASVNEYVEMDKFVEPPLYKNFGESPIWSLLPEEGKESELAEALKNLAQQGVKVYPKSKIPQGFFYSKHRRILQYQVLVPEGKQLLCDEKKDAKNAADHGYDNNLVSQRAFFVAYGPAFKQGLQIGGINQLDIYPLMCHLLGLKPLPHNGSLENIEVIMAEEHETFYTTIITFLVSVGFAATVAGVWCVAACRVYRISRYRRRRQAVGVRLSDLQDDSRNALLSSGEEEIP